MGNFRKIPGAIRKPSVDAWYIEPAKTVLYTEYFGIDAPPPPGGTGNIKAFVGGSFVAKPVKVWNGSSWVIKPLKRWNGSAWVATNY